MAFNTIAVQHNQTEAQPTCIPQKNRCKYHIGSLSYIMKYIFTKVIPPKSHEALVKRKTMLRVGMMTSTTQYSTISIWGVLQYITIIIHTVCVCLFFCFVVSIILIIFLVSSLVWDSRIPGPVKQRWSTWAHITWICKKKRTKIEQNYHGHISWDNLYLHKIHPCFQATVTLYIHLWNYVESIQQFAFLVFKSASSSSSS